MTDGIEAGGIEALVAQRRADEAEERRYRDILDRVRVGLDPTDPWHIVTRDTAGWLQHSFAPRLLTQRVMVIAERIDVLLELGRCREVLPELEVLVAEHPLDERFQAQLMRALYLSGRPSEALASYQSARERLIEETGLPPGSELQGTQWAMLRGEPVTPRRLGEPGVAPSVGPAPSGPCELPPRGG